MTKNQNWLKKIFWLSYLDVINIADPLLGTRVPMVSNLDDVWWPLLKQYSVDLGLGYFETKTQLIHLFRMLQKSWIFSFLTGILQYYCFHQIMLKSALFSRNLSKNFPQNWRPEEDGGDSLCKKIIPKFTHPEGHWWTITSFWGI